MKVGQYNKENLLPQNYDMDNKIYLISNEITKQDVGIGIFKYIEYESRVRIITEIKFKNKTIELKNCIKPAFLCEGKGQGIIVVTEREDWTRYNFDKNTISHISQYINRYGGSKYLLNRINSNQIEYPCPLLIVYRQNKYNGNAFEVSKDKTIDISKYYLYRGRENLFNRVIKEEHEMLRTKKVMMVGLGSIGSQVCIQLLRSGIEKFVLVDYDKLSVENVVKHELTLKDLHEYKTKALKKKMLEINPQSSCVTIEKDVSTPSFTDEFKKVAKNVDLIISSIDDVNAKYILDELALEHRKSVIYVNSFYNANAGVILFSNKNMACLDCITYEIEMMKNVLPDFNEGIDDNYKCGESNYIASANYNSNIVNHGVKVILQFLNGNMCKDKDGYTYNCYFVGNKEMKTIEGKDFFYDDIMIKKYIISGDKECCVCAYE